MNNDTIVAVSTARGRAAIGIVRLSGSDIGGVIDRVFRPRAAGQDLCDRRPHLGAMLDEHGVVIDEGLLLWMAAPRSYTGEDVVELHCHGNPWILERVVNACLKAGARAAEPGEFTRRAYLNGRMDLIQADAVIQVINASSERALRAARRLLSGELSRRLDGIRDRIIDVLKWLEMAIDFPEEDIEQASPGQLLTWLEEVAGEIRRLLESFRQGSRAREGVRVALCGRANVGKSSLFNQLLGFKRSIVADLPGTTRDMIESGVEIGGLSIHFQDTAGLRETVDVLEEEGIRITRDAISGADLVLVVVDGSKPASPDDLSVMAVVKETGVDWLAVMNKSDLGRDADWMDRGESWLEVSARTGAGIDRLKAFMVDRLAEEECGDALLLTSRWQKEILEKVLRNLGGAQEVIRSGMSPEATAYELYEALDRIDELRGGDGREEVLNRIFAEFCLGK